MVRSVLERKRGKPEKREEKESKGKPEKGRNEGERRRSCKSSIVARLEDPILIPQKTRDMDLAYLVIFLSWGHGNGIG